MSLLEVAVRRAGEGGFDKPVAALAALAAGASLLLMPVDVLQTLVIDSGLPGIFPPAEPPLGFKARAVLALVAAVIAFGSTYGLMRLLGRAPARRPAPRETFEPAVFAEPAPRMRRRDLHPDAPVRAPLSALRDLGLPAGEEDPALLLTDALPELAPQARTLPVVEEEEEDELVLTEPEVAEEVAPEPVLPEPAPLRDPQPEVAQQAQGEETIAQLLARLERALEQKPLPQWVEPARPQGPTPPAAAAAPMEPEIEPMDARLRSALENLKRFAPSHG